MMKLLSQAAAVVAVTAFATVAAERSFVSCVPNGANVNGVAAIGHVNPDGNGMVNAFGNAFAAAGRRWTKELCEADTDGDGQTNGQELGDPCCKWTSGDTPSFTQGVSHPGDKKMTADPALWADINCSSGVSAGDSPPTTPTSVPGPFPTTLGPTPTSTVQAPTPSPSNSATIGDKRSVMALVGLSAVMMVGAEW